MDYPTSTYRIIIDIYNANISRQLIIRAGSSSEIEKAIAVIYEENEYWISDKRLFDLMKDLLAKP